MLFPNNVVSLSLFLLYTRIVALPTNRTLPNLKKGKYLVDGLC